MNKEIARVVQILMDVLCHPFDTVVGQHARFRSALAIILERIRKLEHSPAIKDEHRVFKSHGKQPTHTQPEDVPTPLEEGKKLDATW